MASAESEPENLAQINLASDALVTNESFVYPALIDAELAELLTLRGQIAGKRNTKLFAIALVGGFTGSFLSTLFHLPFLFLILLAMTAGLAACFFKTSVLLTAFRERRFDKVTQLLPSALELSTQLSPVSYFQLVQCMQIQYSLLMLEGRYSEFEALNRFMWGVSEKRGQIGKTPKNWALACNLGTALLLQHRFDEASAIFHENISRARKKSDRLVLMCNLIYCLIRTKKFDEAEQHLYEAIDLNGKNLESLVGMRLQFLSASLQTDKGQFESAELSLQHASELSIKLKQPDDFRAYCDAGMAEIRRKQKRFDEADLYFRNAIDVLASADNPSYLDLANIYRDYAETLLDFGRPSESARQMMQAHTCYDTYIVRETETVELIKQKVLSNVPIKGATRLLNLGNRVKGVDLFLESTGPKIIETTF